MSALPTFLAKDQLLDVLGLHVGISLRCCPILRRLRPAKSDPLSMHALRIFLLQVLLESLAATLCMPLRYCSSIDCYAPWASYSTSKPCNKLTVYACSPKYAFSMLYDWSWNFMTSRRLSYANLWT